MLDTAPPRVTLRNYSSRPYDSAIAAARTCYSPAIVSPEEITDKQRVTIGAATFEGGHHTVYQHAHFEFGLENVSRQFVWSFLHSHPFYNSEQQSQRYVRLDKVQAFVPPLAGEARAIYEAAVERAWEFYRRLSELLADDTHAVLADIWHLSEMSHERRRKKVARLAEKTKTTWDDRIVEAMKGPAYYFVLILGGYLAIESLPFGGLLRDALAGALFVVFTAAGCFLASGVLRETLHWLKDHVKDESDPDPLTAFSPFLEFLLSAVVVLSGAIFALHHFGLSLPFLPILLFVTVLLLGWAFKDPASDLAAGFLLSLQRPFSPGDEIEIPGGPKGTVEKIGLLATILRLDSGQALVPNSRLLNEPFLHFPKENVQEKQ